MRRRLLRLGIFFVFLLLSLFVSSQVVLSATGNEFIWTDEPNYLKGDTAHIYGVGFTPYTPVLIKITRPDSSVVTGNGTETPGSDTIITNVDGNFAYTYYVDHILVEGVYTIEAIDTIPNPDVILASNSFLDTAQFLLQGCSWSKGDCTQSALPSWANGVTPMNGWTSGVLKGWTEGNYVPYRLRVNLPKPGDAGTYYMTNEHDNLRTGIPGIDTTADYYVGKMSDGSLTKNCTFQPTRAFGDNPITSNPCIITGHTYTGLNDDPLNDSNVDEEITNGLDNDSDGLIDEDPAGSSSPSRKIQDTWAVLFGSSEAGTYNSKWALYWKAHLAIGSSGFPGATLHGNSTATGSQDVPIKKIEALPPAICGNGIPEGGEQCDDGNIISGDGCSAVCVIEFCGDGITQAGLGETCDDGNNMNGDGCSSTCQIEPPLPLCGNNIVEGVEQCDDGNNTSGDGCSAVCIIEYCGDGVLQAGLGETCDDGNNLNGDGCSSTCLIEPPPPALADLFITKGYTGTVNPGKTLSFTLSYGNTGGSDAYTTVITDDYDQSYIIPSNICCGGIDDGNKITWSAGTVTAGSGPFVLTYDGKIHDSTPDTNAHMPIGITHVVNTAVITTTSSDSDLSDNISVADILVDAEPNLFVTKTVNSASTALIKPGDTVTIVLTYGNNDNNDAPNVVLCDNYNQSYLAPVALTISAGGVDNGDKICWGLTSDSLPGVLSGTRTLPGIDPVVSYKAVVIDSPLSWTDSATITTSDPEPAFKLANNTSSVYLYVEKPTAIRLSSFDAELSDDKVIISWRTGSEINSEGFYLWRSTSPTGNYEKINPILISSKGSPVRGEVYQYIDSTAGTLCQEKCYYKLEEIDSRGKKSSEYGPVTVIAKHDPDINGHKSEDEVQKSDDGSGVNSKQSADKLDGIVNQGKEISNPNHEFTYTIVTDPNGTSKFLSGEEADNAILMNIMNEMSMNVPLTNVDENRRDKNVPPIPNIYQDRRGFLTPPEGFSNNTAPVTIAFRIIDSNGNEVSVASIKKLVVSSKQLADDRPETRNSFVATQNRDSLHVSRDEEGNILTWYGNEPVNGFHILRSESKEGPYRQITATLIPSFRFAEKDTILLYTYIDSSLEKVKEYFYKLEPVAVINDITALR
ncbi:MAG: DUF4215 domain-containing protein [Nitrospirae bacterium]|nr:DUF4215 domain-containing protein [Nitrospirota bacterium]